MNFEFRQKPINLKTAALAVVIGILVGALFVLLNGYNPIEIYGSIIKGAFGSVFSIASTLRWTTPIMLSALAAGIAFRGGMFNMGVEGQIYIGAMAASLVGIYVKGLPMAVHIPLCLIAGMIGGALFAAIPAVLRVYWNTNEIVTTLMLNYIAMNFTDYLVSEHFLADGVFGDSLATNSLQDSALLPSIMPPHQVTAGLFLAIALVVVYYFYIERSKPGYAIRMAGVNPDFARYGGINVGRVRMKVMLLSGAVGGLCGSVEIMGVVGRFLSRFAPNYGFDGMMTALLGSSSPLGIFVSSLFMGMLKSGSLAVERTTDVSRALASVIQGIIICFVSIRAIEIHRKNNAPAVPEKSKLKKEGAGT